MQSYTNFLFIGMLIAFKSLNQMQQTASMRYNNIG